MQLNKRIAVLAAVVVLGAPVLAQAETYTVDPVHSEASFQIRHMMSKVRGRFDQFGGTIDLNAAKPEASAVEFWIEAASINTGNEQRDGHLKSEDFFFVEKNPKITFKSTRIKALGGDRFDVTGAFTMRGVTKEITLPVIYLGSAKDQRGGMRAGFELSTTLNRKEYGINWNAALDQGGFVLADDVTVSINIEAKLEAPAAAKPN